MFDTEFELHLNREQRREFERLRLKYENTPEWDDFIDFWKNKGERNYV